MLNCADLVTGFTSEYRQEQQQTTCTIQPV